MNDTTLKISQACSKLVGISYEEANCWDIAIRFYRDVYSVELANYCDGINIGDRKETENLIYSNKGDFFEVPFEFSRPGDLIVLRVRGIESHIAIYLPNMLMLHTDKTKGCHIDRLGRWMNNVSGFYRLEKTK